MRPFSMFDTVDQAAAPPAFGSLRKNQSSEDILRDAQVQGASPCRAPLELEGVQGEVGEQEAPATPGRLGSTQPLSLSVSLCALSHLRGTDAPASGSYFV